MTQPTLKNALYMQPTMVLYFKPVASTPSNQIQPTNRDMFNQSNNSKVNVITCLIHYGGCISPQTKVMRNCPIPATPVKNLRAQNVGKLVANAEAVIEQASRKAFMVNAILRPRLHTQKYGG